MPGLSLKPQSPQATVCCNVGAAALVHVRPGRPGLPARGFNMLPNLSLYQIILYSNFNHPVHKWIDGLGQKYNLFPLAKVMTGIYSDV